LRQVDGLVTYSMDSNDPAKVAGARPRAQDHTTSLAETRVLGRTLWEAAEMTVDDVRAAIIYDNFLPLCSCSWRRSTSAPVPRNDERRPKDLVDCGQGTVCG
jgi:hypothetical protein